MADRIERVLDGIVDRVLDYKPAGGRNRKKGRKPNGKARGGTQDQSTARNPQDTQSEHV